LDVVEFVSVGRPVLHHELCFPGDIVLLDKHLAGVAEGDELCTPGLYRTLAAAASLFCGGEDAARCDFAIQWRLALICFPLRCRRCAATRPI
jgi:hypothetical protein